MVVAGVEMYVQEQTVQVRAATLSIDEQHHLLHPLSSSALLLQAEVLRFLCLLLEVKHDVLEQRALQVSETNDGLPPAVVFVSAMASALHLCGDFHHEVSKCLIQFDFQVVRHCVLSLQISFLLNVLRGSIASQTCCAICPKSR
jgi:hypothetical protein